MSATSLEQIVNLCKRRGFVFPGSEIYGGLANTWDYGPYGVELKNNVKQFWWKYFVTNRDDIVGLDAAILMNPRAWEASGHVANFTDPLVDCKKCKTRHRGDKLLESKLGVEAVAGIKLADVTPKLMSERIACPDCEAVDWAEAKKFNLMFKTHQGVTEESGADVYLRPETAQGIFVNFKNTVTATRKRLPFGIAQIGKAFRNEITPGNFTFRTREFEQMEIEYFCRPDNWQAIYPELEKSSWGFFQALGVNAANLRWRQHEQDELSHYSSLTKDIEYKFPWGWGELQGLAYRADYDLRQHQIFSGESMDYLDPVTNEKFIPHCIEPSFGCDRTVLTVLLDAYCEEKVAGKADSKDAEEDTRVVLKFAPAIAPIKVAVLPLSKKEPLTKEARRVQDLLKREFRTEYDETQSIGKRYRRQDEIGTPLCVTVDFGTIGEEGANQSEKGFVTVRDRDTLQQEAIKIENLTNFVREKINPA
jgi:glycyl-tRNA synthetase